VSVPAAGIIAPNIPYVQHDIKLCDIWRRCNKLLKSWTQLFYEGVALTEDNNQRKSMVVWNILLKNRYIDLILVCAVLLSFLMLLLASAW